MRLLKYTDKQGYIRHSWVKNDDADPKHGIPYDPPDLSGLPLEPKLQKELHNTLVENNLFTHLDVLKGGAAVTGILRRMELKHLRQQVLMLYKLARS